jgi:hypothetical protein
MRISFFAVVAAVSFIVSGCSIHPLPEDVTGVSTYHIVRQIRCEARDTFSKIVMSYLHQLADARPDIDLFQNLVQQYESDPDSIRNFHFNLFKGRELAAIRAAVKTFYNAGIAYNFELTMTEDNNLSTEVDFIRQIVNPKFTLALSGGVSRKRTNDRTFTATDTFGGLLKLPKQYCDGFVVGPNYVYPIAGRIGIDSVINDFINLTLFANLAVAGASPAGSTPAGGGANPPAGGGSQADAGMSPAGAGTKPASGGASGGGTQSAGMTKSAGASTPTLADKLTFTTSITGSVNPIATFTPIGRNFQVSGANLTGLADRMDVHTVTVAVAIAPGSMADLASLRTFLFSPARVAAATSRPTGLYSSTSVVAFNRVIGFGSPSEQLALLAIDQLKSREFELLQTQ